MNKGSWEFYSCPHVPVIGLVILVKPFLCSFHKRHRAVSVEYPSAWVVKPNTLDSDYFASSLKNSWQQPDFS